MNMPRTAPYKQTKIAATLGPRINLPGKLATLVEARADVSRFNVSTAATPNDRTGSAPQTPAAYG